VQVPVEKEVGFAPHQAAGPGEGGDSDRLVRLTARLCFLIRDANRQSWFAASVREQVDEFHEDLMSCLGEEPALRLEFEPNCVSLGAARLESPPKGVRQLIQMVHRKGYVAIVFEQGLTAFELVVLCQVLQSRTARAESRDLQQLHHVELEAPSEDVKVVAPQVMRPSRLGKRIGEHDGADREVRSLVAEITGAIDNISGEVSPPTEIPRPRVGGSGLCELVDQLGQSGEIALILSSLRRHDEYTYDHSINVGLLSICLARHLGWRGRDLHEFGIAALIHDVGKLYTPLEVLNKPGRLTPAEWVTMKKHPKDGYEILKEGGVGSPIAPHIAIEHHITPLGVGYPLLPYDASRLHEGSQIVKIADVYDAFTTIRPYRSQVRPQEVLKLLRKQAGKDFHGPFVEAFCEMMGEYPIGSTLKLRSGRIALVVDVHPAAPTQPLVRLLRDAVGNRVARLELVDLRAKDPKTGLPVDEVEESIDPVIRNIPIGRYI
jgi:putative nucleotidyltransferase with HDIG domain